MAYRLKDLREDNDLLQKDIANFLGMSQTGYSKYECGTCDIPTNGINHKKDTINV